MFLGENMDINHILNGEAPSLSEYSVLVEVTEKASIELLWSMLVNYPSSHWLLKKLIDQNLREKIPKIDTEEAVNKIIEKLSSDVAKT